MNSAALPIFKNAAQQQFDTDGFVKITLLTDESVTQLLNLFYTYFPDPSAYFFSSSYENDYPRKKEISSEIGKIICPQLETVFNNYT
jgi:hypothetical protein